MVADAMARSRSPVEIFRYRAIGNVSVFILVAPASIRTAPNSPMALDQVMVSPARRAWWDMGRLTCKRYGRFRCSKCSCHTLITGRYSIKSRPHKPD